jgi:hypothetical protein
MYPRLKLVEEYRTCMFGTPVAFSLPTRAPTRAPCKRTSAIATFSIPCATPRVADPGQTIGNDDIEQGGDEMIEDVMAHAANSSTDPGVAFLAVPDDGGRLILSTKSVKACGLP